MIGGAMNRCKVCGLAYTRSYYREHVRDYHGQGLALSRKLAHLLRMVPLPWEGMR